jgi:NAD(P)-dependent dehydrogenase (short-subunit alcohol dehydrogenase family)
MGLMNACTHSPPGLTSLPDGYRVLVMGAGGGIGMALCSLLESDPRCARVQRLGRHAQTGVPAVDFERPDSLQAAALALQDGQPWHALIVASGILHGPALRPEKRLADLEAAAFSQVLAINTVGPALALRHFTPLLPRDPQARSLVGVLSAKVGSIGDNRLGGWMAYRASKAALNMVVKTAAIELARTHKGLALAALHPGTVRTGLSEPFDGHSRGREPMEAAAQLLQVLDALRPEDSGCFKAYDGQSLPW